MALQDLKLPPVTRKAPGHVLHRALRPYPGLPGENPWLAPIRIPLGESRIGKYLGCACWLPTPALPWLLDAHALPWAGLLFACALLWQRLRARVRPSVQTALLHGDGSWQVILRDGQRIEAHAAPVPMAHPLLTLVVLHSSIGIQRVVVWPDSLPASQRRRLRARLLLHGS